MLSITEIEIVYLCLLGIVFIHLDTIAGIRRVSHSIGHMLVGLLAVSYVTYGSFTGVTFLSAFLLTFATATILILRKSTFDRVLTLMLFFTSAVLYHQSLPLGTSALVMVLPHVVAAFNLIIIEFKITRSILEEGGFL